MPSLSELPKLTPTLAASLSGFGGTELTEKERICLRAFIRLIDKSTIEYGEARDAVLAQVQEVSRSEEQNRQEGRVFYMCGFSNHIENCLNATRRLYRLLDAVKSQKGGLTIDRTTRGVIASQFQGVKGLRDALEHLDDAIQNGEVTAMLTVSDDDQAVLMSGVSLRFTDLANLLNRFHKVGSAWLVQFRQEPTSHGNA